MSDMTHYHGDTCDPPHPDPLAEALAAEYERGKDGVNIYPTEAARLARVARDHLAAEIEAAQPTTGAKAARIARTGQTAAPEPRT